ncbi:DUF3040 family protein [Pseudonocardia hierapolitana]|uniref:DUF3040 family protein n=1 Tax=Pseudonocardia hierapolitana TaxID=1128676 RepID=A0A561SJA3_9PSEU|nr:DUF3040 domain-containing protein [Pseudonocardia hierapolitana]TWF74960.1 DUF3040 family protein [Pseudonocardia hierapolitana]
MLNDRERDTLRGVERQFLAEDPDFVRAFEARQTRMSRPGRLGARIAIGAAALLAVFLLVAGSLGGALVVAVATWLTWMGPHQPSRANRRTSWPAREGEPPSL